MAIAIPAGISWPGRLDKLGSSATGSTSADTVLISSFQAADITDPSAQNQGNVIAITDFAAGTAVGSSGTVISLQKSTDNSTWTTIAQILLEGSANYHRSYTTPIYVARAQYCRVVYQQTVAGRIYAEIKGRTALNDLVDL